MSTDVWCVTPASSGGWGPITVLANLAGRLWATEPTFIHPTKPPGRLRRAASLVPRHSSGDRSLLVIVAQPGDLLQLATLGVLAGRYDRVGAWIIDSFWAERTPRFVRRGSTIDHVWVTDQEMVPVYDDLGVQSHWLPWGTDALAASSAPPVPKDIDVLRLGRQPAAWDDDAATEHDLDEHGLTFAGRFPVLADGLASQREVMTRLQRAKIVLASSSLATPADYRHPTRDYISGRFTDAIACGTRIAGTRPRCAAAELLPQEGWIEIDPHSRSKSMPTLVAAADSVTPASANRLRAHAVEHLDWRHRLSVIADALGAPRARLDTELQLCQDLATTLRGQEDHR